MPDGHMGTMTMSVDKMMGDMMMTEADKTYMGRYVIQASLVDLKFKLTGRSLSVSPRNHCRNQVLQLA